jgi:elongation factor G
MSYPLESIRSIALLGHTAAGKTLLTEAILHRAGVIGAQGSLERGSTVSDFDPLEKKYQHSLASCVISFPYKQTQTHLIDTPGQPDFAGQTISALAAVDTAAIVISAQTGVEMVASRMMDWARRRDLCRLIIVNKIDADNVDLPALVEHIQEAFGKECLPINLPAAGATKVVDCFFNPSGESDFSSVEEAHRALIDQVVEMDPGSMEKYLEQGTARAFRAGAARRPSDTHLFCLGQEWRRRA